jgi:RNA polymerase sigma-70 factor (ECF subfamily)
VQRLTLEPTPDAVQPPEPPWGAHSVERLTLCLSALPAREQRIVQLSFYEWKSTGEIAELLGVASGNIRVIRHRALRKLRTCMDLNGDPR